jgi:hypothetical protein
VVWQGKATPAAALKRSHPASPDVEPQPQPLPTRAIPTAVWEDHLLPLLTAEDALELSCTCKALRGVVREHFIGDLGTVILENLQAALTTFPRARSVDTYLNGDRVWGVKQRKELVEWLRGGGTGGRSRR